MQLICEVTDTVAQRDQLRNFTLIVCKLYKKSQKTFNGAPSMRNPGPDFSFFQKFRCCTYHTNNRYNAKHSQLLAFYIYQQYIIVGN